MAEGGTRGAGNEGAEKVKYAEGVLHEGQTRIWKSLNAENPPKLTVLAAGARWGKDRFCLQAMLALATQWQVLEEKRRKAAKLVPSVLCWYVAPTFALLRQSWEELKELTSGFPGIKLNESGLRCFLNDGGVQIEFKSADKPRSLLARGLDLVVCTEAARMKAESWQIIVTRLSSPGRGPNGKGGIAILNSTPNGQNWFYELYLQAKENEKAAEKDRFMQAFHFSSYDTPLANIEELNRHRLILPESVFAQEYLAEFVSPNGTVFKKLAGAVCKYKFPELHAERGGVYAIGIDWGLQNDRTAVLVVRFLLSGKIRLVECKILKTNDMLQQLAIISEVCKRFPSAVVIPEVNSLGDPMCQELRRKINNRIKPFVTNHDSKINIVNSVCVHFERGEIELPEDNAGKCASAEFFAEMAKYEVQRTAKGNITYNAPSGCHDDSVIAFCLAVSGLSAGAGRLHGVESRGF